LIALGADLALGYVERTIQFAGRIKATSRKLVVLSVITLLIVAGTAYLFAGKNVGRIAVGSKDFTEQVILGEILAQAIEARTGLVVERRFDLGGNLVHEALRAGEIDLYVEYTGTALLAILQAQPLKDPQEVYRRVKAEYARRFDLVWTEPLGFNNTFAVLVRSEDAERLGLKTVSDAARVSAQWRAGFGQDFMSRADGYAGFVRTYGFQFQETREMDLSLTYRALAERQVDLIAGNSTDGLISRYRLVQLHDDRNYFPPYDAVPLVRQSALEKFPRLRSTLAELGGILTVEEMRRLNYAVDGEKRAPAEVAREFLKRKAILS
jgi:osmoprotectant transport system permease protein